MAAGCLPGEPSFARCRAGARLPYSASPPGGDTPRGACLTGTGTQARHTRQHGRSSRSSGVNSHLHTAGGLAADDPPSLMRRGAEVQPLRQRSGHDDSTTAPCSGAPCSAYSATAPGVWPRPPKRSATPQASGRVPQTLGHAPKHPSIPQALNCASKRLGASKRLATSQAQTLGHIPGARLRPPGTQTHPNVPSCILGTRPHLKALGSLRAPRSKANSPNGGA